MDYAMRNRLADELNNAHRIKRLHADDLSSADVKHKKSKLAVDKAQVACSDYKAKSLNSGIPLALDVMDFTELISMAEKARDEAYCDHKNCLLVEKVMITVFGEDFYEWKNDQSE